MGGTLLLSPPVIISRVLRACMFPRQNSFPRRQCLSTLSRCEISLKHPVLKVSEEVRDAIDNGNPVVALERFPYPENTALASRLESVVRLHGGVPATVGILNGVARIGFSAEELIELTSSAGKPETKKISRRDLAYVLGLGHNNLKLNGGTTISGTLVLARLAGINVFATGGLGGVHRGGEVSMDVSADLTELGRTRMALISSGCKSFLDIPRTLEYLETQGVCVGTFADGREGKVDFPAFWTRESGTPSPITIENEEQAANMIFAQRQIPLESGLLLANPIPDMHSIPKSEMDAIIAQALQDAETSGSTGSDNTPFVLKRIREITNGASVAANQALVETNVARGTRVAVHLANIERSGAEPWSARAFLDHKFSSDRAGIDGPYSYKTSATVLTPATPSVYRAADVMVAGSLAIDLSCDLIPQNGTTASKQPQLNTSNPAFITQSLGGVGQNVATALHYLNTSVRLCSSVAHDFAGSAALEMLAKRGLQTAGIHRSTGSHHTAQYVAVNDAEKNLVLAMADMNISEDTTGDFDTLWKSHLDTCKPKWLVVDANWHPVNLRKWLGAAKAAGVKVAYEPVSVTKAKRMFLGGPRNGAPLAAVPDHVVNLATPNAQELASMHQAATSAGAFEREDWWSVIDSIGLPSSGSRDRLVSVTNSALVDLGVPQQSIQLLPFVPCILTTLGEQGVLLTQLLQPGDIRLTSPDSAPYILSRSTNGNEIVGGVYMRLFPPIERVSENDIVSVNGVGDTFLGVLIAGLTKQNPKEVADLVNIAQRGSVMTLKSREAVSPEVSGLESSL